jgi:hypothetical protein
LKISEILDYIAVLQSGGEKYFPPGLFPAYRTNSKLGYHRPDTNIFFSAISAFTLQTIRPLLPDDSLKEKVDQIQKGVVSNYPDFRNKDGLKTYNFWRTRPSDHFSNGYLFRHFEHFRIPDDVDDTAMVYLTTQPKREELLWLKEKLGQHANGSKQWARNIYPEYAKLKAYSTWFGKNMYIELDACVLSNILYCLYYYRLPFNQHDEDSLLFIRSVIESRRYRTDPFRCAHQYPRTPLIIYHVARLMGAFEPLLLNRVKPELIETCQSMLEEDLHPMDRVLLSTSLLRFGLKPPTLDVERYEAKEFAGFWFFIAGLLTAYEYKWIYRLARSEWVHMRWECEAHCWVLLAEYMALRDSTV